MLTTTSPVTFAALLLITGYAHQSTLSTAALFNPPLLHFGTLFVLTLAFYWILDTSRRRALNLTLSNPSPNPALINPPLSPLLLPPSPQARLAPCWTLPPTIRVRDLRSPWFLRDGHLPLCPMHIDHDRTARPSRPTAVDPVGSTERRAAATPQLRPA